jgi:hypothetical protein
LMSNVSIGRQYESSCPDVGYCNDQDHLPRRVARAHRAKHP